MNKLLTFIFFLLYGFVGSSAQSCHIGSHEKLYVHTDRANYERGDTVRFRAYLLDTRPEATAYSRYVYAELLADSQVISREMVKDDHGVFSGYLSLGDTLRSGNYTLRFYTRYLSSLPDPRYFYRQIIVGGRPFQDYRKESVTRMAASYHVSFFPEGGRLPSGCVSRVAFKALSPDGLGTDVQGGQSAWRYRHCVAFRPSGYGLLQPRACFGRPLYGSLPQSRGDGASLRPSGS